MCYFSEAQLAQIDNAQVHRVNLVDVFLEGEDIHHMDWEARPPDINTVEHPWRNFSIDVEHCRYIFSLHRQHMGLRSKDEYEMTVLAHC